MRGSLARSPWGGKGIGAAPGRFLPGGNARQGEPPAIRSPCNPLHSRLSLLTMTTAGVGGYGIECEAERHFRGGPPLFGRCRSVLVAVGR